MTDASEIHKAIMAHVTWKVRIHEAIETGSSDFRPEVVMLGNVCDLGRWLYSLPHEEQSGEYWKKTEQIHAKFHIIAGQIMKLALGGKPQEALVLMTDLKGEFVTTSKLLTQTLHEWEISIS